MGEVVVLEIKEGLGGTVLPGVINVVVLSNVCLISCQLVGRALKDVDNEGLSEIPKVGKIPDVELSDAAKASVETRLVPEAASIDKDPGTSCIVSVSILLSVGL